MKSIFPIILLLISNISWAKNCALKLENESICVQLVKKSELSRKNAATLELSFVSGEKKLELDKPLKAKLWMVMKNGHEHGSEPLKIDAKDNAYTLSNAWFLMMGEWKLQFEASINQKVYKSEIPLCIEKKAKDSHVGKCS